MSGADAHAAAKILCGVQPALDGITDQLSSRDSRSSERGACRPFASSPCRDAGAETACPFPQRSAPGNGAPVLAVSVSSVDISAPRCRPPARRGFGQSSLPVSGILAAMLVQDRDGERTAPCLGGACGGNVERAMQPCPWWDIGNTTEPCVRAKRHLDICGGHRPTELQHLRGAERWRCGAILPSRDPCAVLDPFAMQAHRENPFVSPKSA